MKSCDYCGRKCIDSALNCSECGTDQFTVLGTELDASVTKSTGLTGCSLGIADASDTDGDRSGRVELYRGLDQDRASELCEILNEVHIPYQCSNTEGFRGPLEMGVPERFESIVTIELKHHEAARDALEKIYLAVELPSNHFLRDASDEEIIQILSAPAEWSPFDVAHARRLMRERQIDLEQVEKANKAYTASAQSGVPAPLWLIMLGWLFSFLGGIVGIGIAWSLVHLKKRIPEGEFHYYNESSRGMGMLMLPVASIILLCLAVRVIADLMLRA